MLSGWATWKGPSRERPPAERARSVVRQWIGAGRPSRLVVIGHVKPLEVWVTRRRAAECRRAPRGCTVQTAGLHQSALKAQAVAWGAGTPGSGGTSWIGWSAPSDAVTAGFTRNQMA